MVGPLLCWPDMVRLVMPGRASRVAWRELGNKVDAFRWFATADSTLRFSGHGDPDVTELVRRAETVDPYPGLWTTEGLGYYFAAVALQKGARPRLLLGGRLGHELPARSLIPLHTGMGLAFASCCLEGCTTERGRAQIRRQLDRFVELCHDNAKGEYEGATREALGLMTRLLQPRLLSVLDKELARVDSDLRERFWHGVGRALYFAPRHTLPCSSVIWPILGTAYRETPHEESRRNIVAGLGLALTLVNLRNPEVIERFLARYGGPLAENDAFAHGVSSALLIWSRWAPASVYCDALFRHQPDQASPALARQWDTLVKGPCREALLLGQAWGGEENSPGGIFRYRPRRERVATNP
jgi:hypothetical protein